MKRAGRLLLLMAVMIAAAIACQTVLYAQEGESVSDSSSPGPMVYAVSSRNNSGSQNSQIPSESDWRYDYIALNDDGTGVFLYNKAAFTIRWTFDEGTGAFSFTDHKNNEFTGNFDGTNISGDYGSYSYVFEPVRDTLPVYDLSPENWEKDLPHVFDASGMLSDSALAHFSERAQEITDKYDVGVYVVLVDRFGNYTWTGNISVLSEEIRSGYRIGVGPTEKKEGHENNPNEDWKDSILLTVSFGDRKYDLCASGDYAVWAFTEYGREKVSDHFVDDFQENEWYSGLDDFMNNVDVVLKVAAEGHAISFKYDTAGRLISWLVPIVLALLFGYGIAAVMRSSMQNTQRAKNAASYVAGDKVKFSRREDRYIRTLVSRVYSPRQKSSSGGGGGISSSGSSHTSGSF